MLSCCSPTMADRKSCYPFIPILLTWFRSYRPDGSHSRHPFHRFRRPLDGLVDSVGILPQPGHLCRTPLTSHWQSPCLRLNRACWHFLGRLRYQSPAGASDRQLTLTLKYLPGVINPSHPGHTHPREPR